MGTRISQFTPLTTVASADYFPLVQASDTTNKRVSLASLLASVPLGSAATPSIAFTGDLNTGIYSPTADTLAFVEGGSEVMRITSAGLVGIGTSTPGAKLEVNGDILSVGRGTSFGYKLPDCRIFNPSSGGIFAIDDYTNTRFFINSSGNVGIGSTSPGGTLDVVAGNTINYAIIANNGYSSGDQNFLQFKAGSTVLGDFNRPNGTDDIEFNAGFGAIAFGTGTAGTPSERARIDSSGRLLVGTSTLLPSVGTSLIQASSSVADYVIACRNTNATPYGQYIVYDSSPNNTGSQFFVCTDSTTTRFTVRSNGGITNYQANDVNLSDRNAKKDITPAENTWDCIKEWEIVNYHYKDQPDDADFNFGVIAQQIVEICPEVVTIFEPAKDATLAVLDEEGNEVDPAQEAQPEKLGVKEQQMYWMAIKALQEAQVRIESLEASNTDLLARVIALEAN